MVDLIPRDVLFGNPERMAPAVSPDGTRLAHVAPADGILNVWVGPLGGGDARQVSNDRERGVRAFAWDAQEVRHLRELLAMDVDALYSDHVARMVATVGEFTS